MYDLQQQKDSKEEYDQSDFLPYEDDNERNSEELSENIIGEDVETMVETDEYLPDLGMSDLRRFKHMVEEYEVSHEKPLSEDVFRQLKKGQYYYSEQIEAFSSEYEAIIDLIGKCDGQILYTSRMPGTGVAKTSPYYKLSEGVYVILFFIDNDVYSEPLERIEVWDAEGNKLRDIEIN